MSKNECYGDQIKFIYNSNGAWHLFPEVWPSWKMRYQITRKQFVIQADCLKISQNLEIKKKHNNNEHKN